MELLRLKTSDIHCTFLKNYATLLRERGRGVVALGFSDHQNEAFFPFSIPHNELPD